jgi:hypothetical protein
MVNSASIFLLKFHYVCKLHPDLSRINTSLLLLGFAKELGGVKGHFQQTNMH